MFFRRAFSTAAATAAVPPVAYKRMVAIAGCDQGYGYALAKRVAAENSSILVAAGCLTSEGMTRLERLYHPNLHPLPLDVTSANSIKHFAQSCEELSPDWDVFVSNVGVTSDWYVELTDMEDFRQVMEVNYFGVVQTCKTMLPMLKCNAAEKKIKPRILIVSSALGRVALPRMAAFSSSKHALGAFADSLRREITPRFGVLVTVCEPSFSSSPLVLSGWLTGVRRKFDGRSEDDDNTLVQEYASSREAFDEENKKQVEWFKLFASSKPTVVNKMLDYVVSESNRVPLEMSIGWANMLFFRPLSMLPLRVQDWVLNRAMRI